MSGTERPVDPADARRDDLAAQIEALAVAHVGSYQLDIDQGSWTSSAILDDIFGIGPDFDRSVAGWQSLMHPDDREALLAYLLQDVIGAGRRFDREYRIIRACDGAERWVHGQGRLDLDADGRPWRMHGTIQDITTRKRSEIALREREETWRSYLDHAPYAILVSDLAGRVLEANAVACAMTGCSASELLGTSALDLLPQARRDWGRRQLDEARAGGRTGGEVEVQTRDGRSRWWSYELARLPGDRLLAHCHDITTRKTAESELKRRESYLSSIIENQPGLVWLKDAEGRFLAVNRAFARSCGRDDPAALVGKTDLDIWPRELAERYRADDFAVMAGGEPRMIEEPIVDGGQQHWFETFKTPVRDGGGIIGTTGFARDISGRKLAETQLLQSRTMLDMVLNTVPQSVFWKDRDGRYLGCNRLFAELAGLDDPAQIVGKTDDDLPWPPAETEAYRADDREVLERNRPKLHIIEQLQQADGKRVWIDTSKVPLCDAGQRPFAVLGVFEDITERKRAQEQLLQSRTMLDMVLNTVPQSVFWKDRDGRYLGCNRVFAEMAGLADPAQIVGKTDDDLPWPPAETEAYRADDREVLESNQPKLHIIERLQRADGKRIWIDTSKVPLCDAGQRPFAVLGVFEDITERKHAEEALREREAMLRIAGRTARFGGWSVNVADGTASWSEEVALIHELEPGQTVSLEEAVQFYAPEWRERIAAVYRACVGHGTPYDEEMEIITAKGRRVWVRTTGEAIRDEQGRIVQVHGAFQDISAQKRTEEALRESEERLRTLINAMPDIVCFKDGEGRWLEANTFDLRLFQLEGVDYRMKKDSELAEHSSFYRDAFLTCEETDETAWRAGAVCRSDETIPCPGGSSKVFDIIKVPTFGPDGQRKGLIVVGRDITQRKEAEEELKRHAARLRGITDSAQDAIIMMDPDGAISFWNPAAEKILGYAPGEAVGRNLHELLAPEPHLEAHRKAYPDFLGSGQGAGVGRTLELAARRKDGRGITVSLSLSGVSIDGQWHAVGILRDITERLQAEEALRASERMTRAILDQSFQFMGLLTPDGTLIDINRTALELIGAPAASVLGRSFWECPWWTHSAELQDRLRQAIQATAAGETVRFEATHPASDGGLHVVDFSLRPVLDEAGKVVFLLPEGQDITERRLAERHLARSENRYHALIDHMSETVSAYEMVRDAQGAIVDYRVVDHNKPTYMGRPREEALGRLITEILAVDDPPHLAELAEAAEHQAPRRHEIYNPTLRKHFDVSMVSWEPDRVTAIYTDISERRQAEEALRQSEERYRGLFMEMREGFSLHEIICDEQGKPCDYRYLEVNPAFEAVTGIPRSSWIGRTVREVLPGIEDVWIESFGQVALTGQARMFENHVRELDRTYEVVAYSPRPGQFAVMSLDITDRKRAEAALRESEERLRETARIAKVGGWEIDQEGRTRTWSEETFRIHELDPDGPPDVADAICFYHPDDRERVEASVRRALEQGESFDFEARLISAKGNLRWVRAVGMPTAREGKPAGARGMIQDISDRKGPEEERERLQSQLNQAQKIESVGRLAGGVAHDFNNMLGVILGHTEMALDHVQPGDPLHADLMEIRAAAERSANLTRQLLAFARRQTVAPRRMELNETVSSMLQMLRRLIGEAVELSWRPCPEELRVFLDPSQMDQILANLCVNARDAIDGTGRIVIETSAVHLDEAYCAHHPESVPGDYAALFISDTGCGMDAATVAQIFEPFFTTKEQGRGTGLGLATVYGIIKQNHGFVNVYSEPGRGTTFRVYLPLHLEKPGAAVPAEEAAGAVARGGGETILLVEDEPAILKMTRAMLESLGYSVLAAGGPGKAIRLAREHGGRIDLLLTDVVMPEMNGRDLARNILALYPDLRRVFMSGYTADVIAHQGVLEDGVHFIQKPFSVKELAGKLREVLTS